MQWNNSGDDYDTAIVLDADNIISLTFAENQ